MKALTRGERFKDARIVHNQHGSQTMSAVQSATGVSASLIADLENDEKDRKVNYIDVATLAKHYGVTTDWLCGLSEDHHAKPCAASELGLSENSVYFLKSLNDVRTAFDALIHSKPSDVKKASETWCNAMDKVKCLDRLHDYELRAYATVCANYGPSLIDFLISAIEKEYRTIVDFRDLAETKPEEWDIENERMSYDDFVRFKAGEIAKVVDKYLVSEFEDKRDSAAYYDRVTDQIGYLYRFKD